MQTGELGYQDQDGLIDGHAGEPDDAKPERPKRTGRNRPWYSSGHRPPSSSATIPGTPKQAL
jgi:hypothetical protein